jgi:hypothetical protein
MVRLVASHRTVFGTCSEILSSYNSLTYELVVSEFGNYNQAIPVRLRSPISDWCVLHRVEDCGGVSHLSLRAPRISSSFCPITMDVICASEYRAEFRSCPCRERLAVNSHQPVHFPIRAVKLGWAGSYLSSMLLYSCSRTSLDRL